jgi:small subunit ribosomal protein S9
VLGGEILLGQCKSKIKIRKIMEKNYYSGIGRRKEATARVYLCEGTGEAQINGRKLVDYFLVDPWLTEDIYQPLKLFGKEKDYNLLVRAKGGGFHSQAEAIRLGIARALLKVSPEYKTVLKSFSLLTRDARRVERNKIGLKKSRRAPQFSKR